MWDVIIHPCRKFNGGLTKPHWWAVATNSFTWMWLIIHAIILMLVKLKSVSKRNPNTKWFDPYSSESLHWYWMPQCSRSSPEEYELIVKLVNCWTFYKSTKQHSKKQPWVCFMKYIVFTRLLRSAASIDLVPSAQYNCINTYSNK